MFTGLIEAQGTVVDSTPMPGGRRLRVTVPFASEAAVGDSVAVNGVCLTAAALDGDVMAADLGPETVRVTALGALVPGGRVNLERAMRADSRFGGHFVQGHVDGLGEILEIRPDGDAVWLTVAYPPEHAALLISKGAITVDGVSLTVAMLGNGCFDVMIIPFTWAHTTLSTVTVGQKVNLEYDMVGKYVARAAELAREGQTRRAE